MWWQHKCLFSGAGSGECVYLAFEYAYRPVDGFPSGSKNMPAIAETRGQSLSWEDPLEKGKATHSSILAWRIP